MSRYIYAIIPYESKDRFIFQESDPLIYCPNIPELTDVNSEFTDPEMLTLHKKFLEVNTCYRQSAFTGHKDGYSHVREEIYHIAKAIGANEVWYVEEPFIDTMELPDFSFDNWRESLKKENATFVVELSIEVLKGNDIYSFYHDGFSDLIRKEQ